MKPISSPSASKLVCLLTTLALLTSFFPCKALNTFKPTVKPTSTFAHRSHATRAKRRLSTAPVSFANHDLRLDKNFRTRPNNYRTTCNALAISFPQAAINGAWSALSTTLASNGQVELPYAIGINVILFAVLRSKLLQMLTPQGFAHALALGSILWATMGWKGWTVCVSYLFLGQIVTKIRFKEKESAGIAEKRGGRRGPENVWGSALTGAICACCSIQNGGSFLGIETHFYVLAYVASLATKLADTFASEVGKAYGKTTFLITTFERVPPGTEGAVSAEGTAAAVLGGALLSLVGYALNLVTLRGVFVATVAAFLATNVESLIGATLQDKKGFSWMTNEVVNFINTVVGATLAIVGGKMFLVG